MDMDGDGYISYKDFEAHLLKNKINASQDEVLALMHGWLDVDRKGFIDFAAFQKKFGPRMSSQIEVAENENHSQNLVPSLSKLNEYG